MSKLEKQNYILVVFDDYNSYESNLISYCTNTYLLKKKQVIRFGCFNLFA